MEWFNLTWLTERLFWVRKVRTRKTLREISAGRAIQHLIPLTMAKAALWVTRRRMRHILSLRMLRAHTLTRSIIIRHFTSPIIATNKTLLQTHIRVSHWNYMPLYCNHARNPANWCCFSHLTSLESASRSGAPPQEPAARSQGRCPMSTRVLARILVCSLTTTLPTA